MKLLVRALRLAALSISTMLIAAHADAYPTQATPQQVAAPSLKASRDVGLASHAAHVPPMPRKPSLLPRSNEELLYDLPPSNRMRPELLPPGERRRALEAELAKHRKAGADCHDMSVLAGYQGAALADYVANLPDSDCTRPLFSVTGSQAATIFSAGNLDAVAARFASEGAAYSSTNGVLLNLTEYLRAAYYVAFNGGVTAPSASVGDTLRTAITQLVSGNVLFSPNQTASTTAGEVVTLITNMHDEANYLDLMKQWVTHFTNTPTNPNAAAALDDPNVGYGFTGILKVFYYSHYRDDALPKIENDPSYPTTLYGFVRGNYRRLLNDATASFQLSQAATEAFRFAMHPALLPTVSPLMKDAVAHTKMMGPDRLIWLAGAQAVENYDNANCSYYGTCNFEVPLAAAVLSKNYPCSNGFVRLRTEELTADQAAQACNLIDLETPYFHTMLNTHQVPVADDYNKTLEVAVFSNSTEYETYSSVFFGNDTNNGGVYLEGNPASPTNQARFIAYEADWLRPQFEIWNLKHEFVHYLDGRFDMYGDFTTETQVPDVWYIEGLAEYISKENDDQDGINAAMTGQYKLSDIFQNTYGMDDYVNRAYPWGYMSVRFVFERHPEILATILPLFRSGDYAGYWTYMQGLSTGLDAEFAAWVPTVTTAGTPTSPWNRHRK
ncbi:collagenase [Trinickia fusca]|uniref:microbial collagenase n=1 Tax=Trinickia fusca TaxID=2419777 RepID=A0A494X9S1_9BURK|nr:collagenase [Trinickia fusca]RKP46411.1 collagenase [Trinickia fusca]